MSLNSNNNNKVIRELARRSLKVNPFRNWCILVAITLCITLMVLVPMINTAGFQVDFAAVDLQEQVIYGDLSTGQIAYLKDSPELSCALLNRDGPALRVGDFFVRPVYMEYSEDVIIPYTLKEGSLPRTYNEGALEKQTAAKLQLSVGDTITLADTDGTEEIFEICGLVETPDSGSGIQKFYVSKEYADMGKLMENRAWQMYVQLKKLAGMSKDEVINELFAIGEEAGIPGNAVSLNTKYLDSMIFSSERLTTYIFINLGILLTGILVIYSVFYISVISRVSLFGQLGTIGMSRRQIRRFVNREGLILSIKGTLAGILLAGIISYCITVPYWDIEIFMAVAVTVGVLSTLFIMLSIQKPAKAAAAISPIEAARYHAADTKEADSTRMHKISPRSLASMRFRRDRKRAHFTMLSLIIGGILFIISSAYISSVDITEFSRNSYFRNAEYLIKFGSVDETVYYNNLDLMDMQKQGLFTDELTDRLSALPQVESVKRIEGTIAALGLGQSSIYEDISFIDRERFDQDVRPYLLDQSLTYDDLLAGQGIIYTRESDSLTAFGYQFRTGDPLPLDYYNGKGYVSRELPIMGFTRQEFIQENYEDNGLLIPAEIRDEMFPGIDMTKELMIKAADGAYSRELDEAVKLVVAEYPLLSVITFNDQVKEIGRQITYTQQLLIVVSVFGILFGIINVLNTTLTTMVSRDKELALLESIGMSGKQIKQMLVYESLLLTLPSIVISILIGGAGGYGFVFLMAAANGNPIDFSLPVWVVALYILLMISVPLLVSWYFYERFSRRSLTDRLKAM